MKKIILLLVTALILGGGCSTLVESLKESEPDNSAVPDSGKENVANKSIVPEEEPAMGMTRPFEEGGLGFTGPAEQEYCIFNSWDELLLYIPREDLFTDINFSTDMVLACFMGEKPTGGFMSRITEIEETRETLTVYVEITEPEQGDLVAQMVTSPWQAVVTEKSDKKIIWTEIRAER